jgi:hypothetical protein
MMTSILLDNTAKQVRDYTIDLYDEFLATKAPYLTTQKDLNKACANFITSLNAYLDKAQQSY